MRQIFDDTIKKSLDENLRKLEEHFKSDVIFYYGEIHPSLDKVFRDFIEQLKKDKNSNSKRLTIILNTPGGHVETVEKMVHIIRFHYDEVYFVVPDYAMSAGTVFCMSGDKIFMDYSSSLGPIDPQVYNGKNLVPALGYLDKVEELIAKSAAGKLTEAEYLMLKDVDLAEIRFYEMARDLTVNLLKEWLVKYKFKNWKIHASTGKEVTDNDKQQRAETIAKDLGNNSTWQSHGRPISIDTLKDVLKLQIEDYSNDQERTTIIREYNDLLIEYIKRTNQPVFMHSRVFF